MRLSTTLGATVLAAAALFAAGCGDDDNGSDSADNAAPVTTQAAAPATTPTQDAPATGDSVTIAMKDIQFDPKDQAVKVGTKVTWTNEDSVPHNVVAEEGAEFESDTFGEGGTYEFTPDAAGTISYVCTLHPGMDGTLQVTD